jgi:hypothetical protein
MRRRSFRPDLLSDLGLPQPPDRPGTDRKTDHKGGQDGVAGPKRNISEDIKERMIRME